MITLFIDTSSSDVSIAILKENTLISSITKTIPNQHSVYTVSFIDQVIRQAQLTPKDIQRIMVVTGPGSFTGVRIGVTIAKVYAYLNHIDIIEVSSLKMRALSRIHQYCLSLIDAHHNNYYLGLYNEQNEEVIPEQFASKEKVLEIIKKYQPTLISDEEITLEGNTIPKQTLDLETICSYYQSKSASNPHLVVPNYLKLPQALEEKHD